MLELQHDKLRASVAGMSGGAQEALLLLSDTNNRLNKNECQYGLVENSLIEDHAEKHEDESELANLSEQQTINDAPVLEMSPIMTTSKNETQTAKRPAAGDQESINRRIKLRIHSRNNNYN